MKKGSVVTEDQIWWRPISDEAWASARAAAAARAANGNPMTDDEIEFRARNAQDREDIRYHCNGGFLSAQCKNMTRSDLIEEINRQLQAGLYGAGSKNGYKAYKNIVQSSTERRIRRMISRFNSTCNGCHHQITAGTEILYDPTNRVAYHTTCH